MGNMLAWLLVGHLVGDFLLQTRWMAEGKTKRLTALAAHAAVYTGAAWLASVAGQYGAGQYGAGQYVGQSGSLASSPVGTLSLFSLIILFVSHALIDRRGFVRLWCQYVTKGDSSFLFTMTDQTLHCVVLALVCILEAFLFGLSG